jgi:hypothetical protein
MRSTNSYWTGKKGRNRNRRKPKPWGSLWIQVLFSGCANPKMSYSALNLSMTLLS